MRVLILFATLFLVTACYDDVSDLQEYLHEVKDSAPLKVSPIPKVKEFKHIEYGFSKNRSPFDAPLPEAVSENFAPVQNCLAPDPRRRKQPLEKFALDNLRMKGTLGNNNAIWALVEASDGTLHRVTNGNFIGLFNGRIISVSDTEVKLMELIPDGAGCWKERGSVLPMVELDE